MRILCIPYTHTLSHLSRPLAVAKELHRQGHEIQFAGQSPKTGLIKNAGFQVHPLAEPDPVVLFDNIRKGKLRFVSDEEVERMVRDDLQLYEKSTPDLVLTDGRFSAAISTQIAGLNHAAIVNVSSTEYRSKPYIPMFDWMPIGLGQWTKTKLESLNLLLEMTVFNNTMSIFKRLSKKHRLEKPVTATTCLEGNDLTLLADIPEYFPTKRLPPNYHYIGPLTWKGQIPPPSWWPPKSHESPILYVTMGTTGVANFFPKILELLKSSPFTAVLTTGSQVKQLEGVKGKVYVEDFIDGDLATGISDVVVCHGGNGTIYQALQHGKPIVGIPTIPDQAFNMRRVEALGVGMQLSWREFSRDPGYLLRLVDTVIAEPSYREKARQFKDQLAKLHPATTAADWIEKTFSA